MVLIPVGGEGFKPRLSKSLAPVLVFPFLLAWPLKNSTAMEGLNGRISWDHLLTSWAATISSVNNTEGAFCSKITK
jgi:hypothetical protein